MIKLLGLSDFFQAVVVGGECEKPKPAPFPYLKALKELGASAAHTFIFEDSASGTRAGVAAGVPVIAVLTRNPEKSLQEAGAALIVKDYADPKLWSVSGGGETPAASTTMICRSPPLEAMLLDIDGTMCVSDPFHHRAFSELLQRLGYNGGAPITPEFGMTHMAGRSNEQIGRFLFPSWPQPDLDAFFAEKEALFARYAAQGLREVPGLTALLRWAATGGIKVAAVSNAPRGNAELMISILGLTGFFEVVVAGEDCGEGRCKPAPDLYLRALDLIGVGAEKAVVFEDSVVGVSAGVAAGIPVVAVAGEGREARVVAAGASLVVRDYHDAKLWAALEKAAAAAEEEEAPVESEP